MHWIETYKSYLIQNFAVIKQKAEKFEYMSCNITRFFHVHWAFSKRFKLSLALAFFVS